MTHQSARYNRWFHGILAVNILLLIVTLLRTELGAAGGWMASLRQLSLSGEHNLASWWSGSLLLLGALHAADGYFLHRMTQPQWARAWAILAFILLALSTDEVGSLHERADQFLHAGIWISLVPFALIALALVGIMLRTLWSVPGGRSAAWLVTLGFGCLAAVVPQEYLEHKLAWQGWAKAIRGMVEEGMELAGFMLLLAAAMPNSLGIFRRSGGTAVPQALKTGRLPAFDAMCSLRMWLSLGGIVLGLGLAAITSSLTDHGRGRPGDWPPAVLFALAALAANLDFLRRGVMGVRELMAGGLTLFASVTMVALLPRHTLELPFVNRPFSLRVTLVLIAALGAVALLAVPGRVLRPPTWTIVGALIAVLGVGAASIALSPIGLASHAIPALLAVIVFDAWARAASRERLA
jgi:hypothetical protein